MDASINRVALSRTVEQLRDTLAHSTVPALMVEMTREDAEALVKAGEAALERQDDGR